MRSRLHPWRRLFPRGGGKRQATPVRPLLERLEDRLVPSSDFVQTNLVSDVPGLAQITNANSVNAWGLTASPGSPGRPGSPFWVANQGSGTSTLYSTSNSQTQVASLVVNIPANPADNPLPAHGSPTGDVFNSGGSAAFDLIRGNTSTSAIFLFATTDGTISGWNPGVNGTNAVIGATNPGAEYTGLAIANDSKAGTLLYAADFSKNTIDVYGTNFKLVTSLPGDFTDPNLPAGYRVFNVQAIDNKLYVEYAPFAPTTGGVEPGTGHGVVDVYNTDGTLDTSVNGSGRLITGGPLNDPWGIAQAPANFGAFSNDLLVGNFGSGNINAFDPTTGKFLGELMTSSGQPFDVEHLWSLQFGNGSLQGAGPTNTLFFTAGLTSHFGTGTGTPHGLFGSLQAVPTLPPKSPIVTNLVNLPQQIVSTVPSTNGDQNPYGVAFVPQDFKGGGLLAPGDILVSNFNNASNPSNPSLSNVQGTGSTIVKIAPDGQQSVFFQGQPGLGLTTALGVLPQGFVLVGSAPATTLPDGTHTVGNGALLILDSNGNQVGEISDPAVLQGPWDLTIHNVDSTHAQVFVSNVLSGTVERLDLTIPRGGTPMLQSATQIASGFMHGTNASALVVGPTGLAFDPKTGILYVASTADNAIFAIPDAAKTPKDNGTGNLVTSDATHLNGPLGLTLAPNGDLIVANGDAINPSSSVPPNLLLEFKPNGQFVGQFQIDNGAAGAAFGLAVQQVGDQVRFAAVDDNSNSLDVWTFLTGDNGDNGVNGQDRHHHDSIDEVFSGR